MRGGRLWGVDAARGIALLGMMTVHVIPNVDPLTGQATWSGEVFAGRSAALFAVLAGVGLALLTGGTDPDRPAARVSWDRKVIAVRALIIAAAGFAVAELPTGVAIILVHYGVLFLLALPFLRLGFRSLAALAALWTAAAPPVYWYLQNALRPGEPGAGTMDPAERLWSSPAFGDLADPWLLGLDLAITGYYPLLLWPAYLFAGMAIGRLNLRRTHTAVVLLATGGTTAAATWAAGRLWLEHSAVHARMSEISGWPDTQIRGELLTGTHYLPLVTEPGWFLMGTPHQGSTVDLVHTIGAAAAVVGLCLLAAGWLRWLIAPLAGAGSMPLSLYVGHLVVLAFWRGTREDGTPWPAPEAFRALSPETMAVVLAAAALLLGLVKVLLRRRGPLEAVTYAAGTAVAGPRP